MITMTPMILCHSSFTHPNPNLKKTPLSFEHSHVVGKCLAVNFSPAHRTMMSFSVCVEGQDTVGQPGFWQWLLSVSEDQRT